MSRLASVLNTSNRLRVKGWVFPGKGSRLGYLKKPRSISGPGQDKDALAVSEATIASLP